MPKEYNSEIDIFLKQNVNILPDHRGKDHKIDLLKNKQAFFVRNYKPLLKQKTDTMKKYIDEYLRKSFIRPSLSTAIAPIILVRKPED